MMKRLALIAGFLRFYIGITLLGVALIFSTVHVLVLLASSSLISYGLAMTFSQWGLLKLLQGQVPRTHGLRNSYERAYEEAGIKLGRRPILVTFADPIPNMFVIRATGGSGMIILSEGFISILDESELRFVLTRAIRHLVSAEVVLQSACLLVMTLLQRRFDGGTAELKAGTALKKLILFPWLRFFSALAFETGSVTRRAEDFVRGASKLARVEQLYGQQAALPGLVYLGIER
jgi:Zn-dependent protease with chaperone function